jgi:hypothetical protein
LGWSTPPRRADRIEVFVRGYDVAASARHQLGDAIVHNACDRAAFGEAMYEQGREPFASWWAADRGAGDQEDIAVTEQAVNEWLRRYG